MRDRLKNGERYVGQMGLLKRFGLRWPEPFVVSITGAGSRQTVVERNRSIERYTRRCDYGDTAIGDLKFALRYEPLDLGLLLQAFHNMLPDELQQWLADEPTGRYSRRAWFFFEHLTGHRLALPDVGRGSYVPALNPEWHIVAEPDWAGLGRSERHRIVNNLLGGPALCPTVRRTPKLTALMAVPIANEARQLLDGCDPDVLQRAVGYLFTKETKSSFEIEHEQVDESRTSRFVRALQNLDEFNPVRDYLKLQHLIVKDPRFHAQDWRDNQIFVGSRGAGYQNKIHYICPRPNDVYSLMGDLKTLTFSLFSLDSIDPIIAAALVSFAFVFIHPFEDGNGRIHRYLIHWMLARGGVTPPGVLFPVSASMLRDMRAYDAALESVSARIMPFIDWRWVGGEGGGIEVLNDTADLYRFFDATAVAEYLYERVIDTVRKDLPEELAYVAVYDRAYRALTERFDGLPGPKVSLLASLCLQNGGQLAKGKRRLFPMLEDGEIAEAEAIVTEALAPDEEG